MSRQPSIPDDQRAAAAAEAAEQVLVTLATYRCDVASPIERWTVALVIAP